MKIIKIIVIVLSINLLSCKLIFAIENKILFKINNEIITTIDIVHEAEYLKLLNQNLTKLDKNRIFEISKNSIIREKIKFIELSKYTDNFSIDEEYYDVLIEDFFKKLGLKNIDDFKKLIIQKNLDLKMIEKKIQIELLWNRLILEKFSKDIKIDEKKIEEEILKNGIQKEYLMSEILFTLEADEKLNEKFESIKKEISLNGFENAAFLFSISSSSNNGGDLGWIKFSSLNKKIKNNINNINLGDISNPITIPGGFLILKIRDVREKLIKQNIENERKIITREIANKQLNQFSNIFFNKLKKEVQINEFN